MDKQKYLDGEEEGYKSFGAYDHYKQNMLDRLFGLTKDFHIYTREYYEGTIFDELDKTSKVPEALTFNIPHKSKERVCLARWSTPDACRILAIRLQNFIRLLKPKIKKLKKDQRKKYELFNTTLKTHPDLMVGNLELFTNSYELIIELMEELGYTDMSIKSDVDGEVKF
jgi:hypothetical protein